MMVVGSSFHLLVPSLRLPKANQQCTCIQLIWYYLVSHTRAFSSFIGITLFDLDDITSLHIITITHNNIQSTTTANNSKKRASYYEISLLSLLHYYFDIISSCEGKEKSQFRRHIQIEIATNHHHYYY